MNRGQATLELALAAPLIAGLLALTLQAGVLISDQVNLEHSAYEGAQWALAHPNAPTTGLGSIQEHLWQQLCGNSSGPPTADPVAYPYCKTPPAGISPLSVSVSAAATSMAFPHPTAQVLGATNCKSWALSIIPPPPQTVSAGGVGGSITYTIALAANADGTTDPVATLYAGGYPQGLSNGSPLFVPPTVSAGFPSNFTINTSANTPPGTYQIAISARDQCGVGPKSAVPTQTLIVSASGSSPSPVPGICPDISQVPTPLPCVPEVGGVDASSGVCASVPTLVKVHGSGFLTGATVTVGGVPAAGVAVLDAGTITATVTMPSGTYDVTVTNPSLSSATLTNGLKVLPSGCPPSPLPGSSTKPCAGGSGPYHSVINVTWYEPLAIPWLSSGTPPNFKLVARHEVFCQ